MIWTPDIRLARLLALSSPLWLLALWLPLGWLPACLWLLALLLQSLRQMGQRLEPRCILGQRILPRLAYNQEALIELQVCNCWDQPLKILLRDQVPAELGAAEQLFQLQLGPGQQARLYYSCRPQKRGRYQLGQLLARISWGPQLWQRHWVLAESQSVTIYPCLKASQNYELLARLAERDEARRPRVLKGAGSDYESLRPYQPGDDTRRIDWKSSARQNQLVFRNPQVEKGQHLALLIDCGRMMASCLQGHPRLEHALEAALRLSHVVSKRGDTLSLAGFSNQIECLSPLLKGPGMVGKVKESLTDLEVRSVESDYWQVTAQVLSKLSKRSLVILFTEVLDSAASRGLLLNLQRAAKRHLVLCVVLSDPELASVLERCPSNLQDSWELAAACDVDRRRRLALESMRSSGILVLDCRADQLSHQLIRRYLEIRQANLQ